MSATGNSPGRPLKKASRRIRKKPECSLLAVIEIGSTAIRMNVAQIQDGNIATLETLQQSVSLGKDTFTRGSIDTRSTEECVKVLRSYRRLLNEYHIKPEQVRAVATSAVREASNQLAFLDRVFIATGVQVEVIDDAEASRLMYLSMQPLLRDNPSMKKEHLLVVETSGGSTEVLGLTNARISFAQTYRLGSLRIRETLNDFSAPADKLYELIGNQIRNMVAHMSEHIAQGETVQLLFLGREIRFAVEQLMPDWDRHSPVQLRLSTLEKYSSDILSCSVDQLVRRYHISFPEAETLGPALLGYISLIRAFNLRKCWVGEVALRNGLLIEMSGEDYWSEDFSRQVVYSALELGRKYHFDEKHAEHVTHLALEILRYMKHECHFTAHDELLLRLGGLLHDIGAYVSNRSHHKHSMYLILNSDLFGLGAHDVVITALIARYHRRAMPRPNHEEYNELDRAGRITVAQLAAILRVADALDRTHTQRIRKFSISQHAGKIMIMVENVMELSFEQLALREKGKMFQQVFGKSVVLVAKQKRI